MHSSDVGVVGSVIMVCWAVLASPTEPAPNQKEAKTWDLIMKGWYAMHVGSEVTRQFGLRHREGLRISSN